MSEFIDPSDGLFTPIGAPKLALGKRLPSMFKNGAYPTQIEGWLPGFAGEQRGFFANNRWRPAWSAFNHARGSATGRHGGVDIFASLGTPVVAVVDGELTFIPEDGDAIGNRAHLVFTDSGLQWRFTYGHLKGFSGANRSVLKGDIIGFSGCTGNAGGAQPCSVPNSCGKFSTHVHFMLMRDQDKMRFNPTEALSWTLRYQDDTRDAACDDVV